MTFKAKEILNNKFWIVEDGHIRVGTLSKDEDRYIFTTKTTTSFFDNKKQVVNKLGIDFTNSKKSYISTNNVNKEVHGYPTNVTPYNSMFDVRRKLPLFTKSNKSTSLYCAGYYIIRFDKGWVKSFCPKLITVDRYETKGPFTSQLEMRQELTRVVC